MSKEISYYDFKKVSALLEKLKEATHLIVSSPKGSLEAPITINLLLGYLEKDPSTVTLDDEGNFSVLLNASGSAGKVTIDEAEAKSLMSEIKEKGLFSADSTATSGLIYLSTIRSFADYNRNTGVLLLPNNKVVPSNKRARLLSDSRNVYQKFASKLIPEIAKARAELMGKILASQKTRGFKDSPKVGDKVMLRDFSDIAEEYGSDIFDIGEGIDVSVAKASTPTYGIPFINGISYLKGLEASITSIDDAGIVELHFITLNKSEFNTLQVGDETLEIDETIKFHETFLINAHEV